MAASKKRKKKGTDMIRYGNEEVLTRIDDLCKELEDLWSQVSDGEKDVLCLSIGHKYFSYFGMDNEDNYILRNTEFMEGYHYTEEQ